VTSARKPQGEGSALFISDLLATAVAVVECLGADPVLIEPLPSQFLFHFRTICLAGFI
jgi:hypothetical protein